MSVPKTGTRKIRPRKARAGAWKRGAVHIGTVSRTGRSYKTGSFSHVGKAKYTRKKN